MNNNEWGLTEKGFRRPTYVECLNAIEYKARELFGDKANLTVRSPLGIFLRIFAWAMNLLFSLLEDVYNSRFVDTAVGTSLYNLGKAIGLQLLPAQKASGYITFTGTVGTRIPAGFLVHTISNLQYAVLTAGLIDSTGQVTLPVQAVETGDIYNIPASSSLEATNPITGLTSMTNSAAIDGGRGRETDEEFRDRYYLSTDFSGGVNADAIAAEILQNVEGVTSALVYENDTDETDSLGLPPHSVEAVVYGGLDQDVAESIFRRKAAGIQTYGNKSIEVLGKNGQTYSISFSRPTAVPVYIKVENLSTSSAFPEDGQQQIKAALVNYIGSDVSGGLGIGENVIYMALPGVILTVSGVLDFELSIGKSAESYSTENITIGVREKAITDMEKVVIVS